MSSRELTIRSRRPVIGSRWIGQERMRFDAASGEFEHSAPARIDADSLRIQRAFLAPTPKRGIPQNIADALLATVIGICLAAALVHYWAS